MRTLIIDKRMRNVEKEYFLENGFNLVELQTQKNIYEEVSSHVDIFFCKIGDSIISGADTIDYIPEHVKNVHLGNSVVSKEYPNDIKYNVACIGKRAIHTFKNTDYVVKKIIKQKEYEQIPVKQGYSRCSIVATSDNSCITSDIGIAKILRKNNIDVLYINEETIRLLKKDSSQSLMNGFIGGATYVLDNKFILFGDINKLKSAEKIKEHIKKYNLELVDFKDLEVTDYGSCMEV
ncbi:MAG: hypothetical protein RR594_02680 [Clostridia bacterium]